MRHSARRYRLVSSWRRRAMASSFPSSRAAWAMPVFGVLLLAVPPAGCARYQVGAQSLFSPDISTVYVPMIESHSLRRNLGERLTEAVVKEIEKQTPYKVVDSQSADSILAARIVADTKRITVNNRYDDGRDNQITFLIKVSWIDRRGDVIRREQMLPVDPQLVSLMTTGDFIPEIGQSVTTAQQVAIQRAAEQIVAMMEIPW